jgi:hypothetical protein
MRQFPLTVTDHTPFWSPCNSWRRFPGPTRSRALVAASSTASTLATRDRIDGSSVDPVVQRVENAATYSSWHTHIACAGVLALYLLPGICPFPACPRAYLHPSSIQAEPLPSSALSCTPSSVSGRRWRACALATVRRSNCTCSFPAYSFHEDSRFRGAIEGINWIKFTSPYSPYSLVSGNCRQPPLPA